MNKLNKLYKLILEALNCKIKDDYSIVMMFSGNEYPVKVDGKQVYLPVNEALNVISSERAFFHPACEAIISKETEMDKVIKKLITSSIYFIFKPIGDVLFKVANKSNKSLGNKLIESLLPLKGVDKKTISEVAEIVKRISMNTEFEGIDNRIIQYTLTRGGKTEEGESIYYRCTPSYPFYNEVSRVISNNSGLDDKTTILFMEVSCTLKALKIVSRIFELAIPSVVDPTRCESCVLTPVASRLTAMLSSFSLVAGEVNSIIGRFRKEFDEIGVYGVNLSWVESLDELPDIATLVHPLQYNNYETNGKSEQTTFNNPFDIPGMGNVFGTTQSQQNTQPAQNSNGKGPTAPPPKPGETYVGVNVLPNGLIEFKYKNGTTVRVYCVDENGKFVSEQYQDTTYQQPLNQPYQQPMIPYGQPNNGWQQGAGFTVLPNGVVFPHPQPNVGGVIDPYGITQPQPQQGGGWGAYEQQNTGASPMGNVFTNW